MYHNQLTRSIRKDVARAVARNYFSVNITRFMIINQANKDDTYSPTYITLLENRANYTVPNGNNNQ